MSSSIVEKGWRSYNKKDAPSFGFEYKEDISGNVLFRHSENRRKVFTFPSYPSPDHFFLLDHYPTLVGLNDDALIKLVMENRRHAEKEERSSSCIITLRNDLSKREKLGEELRKHLDLVKRKKEDEVRIHIERTMELQDCINSCQERLDDMDNQLKALSKSATDSAKQANEYAGKYSDTKELLNLTVSALGCLKHIPESIKVLQEQMDMGSSVIYYSLCKTTQLMLEYSSTYSLTTQPRYFGNYLILEYSLII